VAVKVDNSILNGCHPYSFRIHGPLYHKMGTLLPAEDHQPFYAQLCIHDQQAALATHNTQNPNLDHVLMGEF